MNRTPGGQEFFGQRGWGAKFQKVPTRNLRLRARDFVDIDQSEPIPLFFGTVRVAGVAVTPVFDLVSREVSEGGK